MGRLSVALPRKRIMTNTGVARTAGSLPQN
nr:MAG TPA: hypothetical protein [Caudoviricetes sp.]